MYSYPYLEQAAYASGMEPTTYALVTFAMGLPWLVAVLTAGIAFFAGSLGRPSLRGLGLVGVAAVAWALAQLVSDGVWLIDALSFAVSDALGESWMLMDTLRRAGGVMVDAALLLLATVGVVMTLRRLAAGREPGAAA